MIIPWTLITDIDANGWYVHRWGDWLEVLKVARRNDSIFLTVRDTDGSTPTWSYKLAGRYNKPTELIATKTPAEHME